VTLPNWIGRQQASGHSNKESARLDIARFSHVDALWISLVEDQGMKRSDQHNAKQ
jgi:hypothetical protein